MRLAHSPVTTHRPNGRSAFDSGKTGVGYTDACGPILRATASGQLEGPCRGQPARIAPVALEEARSYGVGNCALSVLTMGVDVELHTRSQLSDARDLTASAWLSIATTRL
jgi:hypothetical protein